tara:strand:- start:6295 stop:9456 length:3162 start_codon:yes stop_codon:yes gene_type:complete
MAEKVYKSAGVFATETDLSRPTAAGPSGVPAGVVGTAEGGPAFVPVTVGSYSDFRRIFGDADGSKFGPLAVYNFLQKAEALTYLRVLGVGDGKQRSTATGKVNRAGFVVGNNQVQNNGIVSRNIHAVQGAAGSHAPEGRTYFLGCFMSQSDGSTYLSDAGIQDAPGAGISGSAPIIRGVLLAPSGVIPQLSGGYLANSSAPSLSDAAVPGGATLKGSMTGSVNISNGMFGILLNGYIPPTDSKWSNVITASFNADNSAYFARSPLINRDMSKIEEAGHCLYSWYDINPAFAVVTGSGILQTGSFTDTVVGGVTHKLEDIGFILTGSAPRNTSVNNVTPNYESFEDRFQNTKTPHFISQDFGGTKYNLFKVVTRGDGGDLASKYKVSIQNITPAPANASSQYGTFDVLIRNHDDSDRDPQVVEAWIGLTLDPSSEKYVARVIGDQYTYFDFDQDVKSQKLVVKGDHAGYSAIVRVEVPRNVELGNIPQDSLPVGFRGPSHLVTSGSGPLASLINTKVPGSVLPGSLQNRGTATNRPYWKSAVTLPIRLRNDIKTPVVSTGNQTADAALHWGVQFKRLVAENKVVGPLGSTYGNELRILNLESAAYDESMSNRSLYFPNFDPISFKFIVGDNPGAADVNGTVLDSDRFNNNMFTLERIRVKTGSNGLADSTMWQSASYIRNGVWVNAWEDLGFRFLKVSDLRDNANRRYGKFTVFMQGGFNGTDLFNKAKNNLTTVACKREMDDVTNQGGIEGATTATYRKSIDIMGVKSDVDIKLLAIPGIRNAGVTDYAMDAVESRFDSMYIMDIEQRDRNNQVMTSSVDANNNALFPNVHYTVSGFASRGLNTSFTAAYFPDLVMKDPTNQNETVVPPSVGVLAAMATTDKIAWPWFAPAGYTRGTLGPSIKNATLTLTRQNLDDLYAEKINPITSFSGGDPIVWGQKTLLADASALDRINVRRLLINVRRLVKNVANSMLFEPNRQETLDRFNALVKPIMQRVQKNSGVDRYKVVIDTTTTTQADIENNTIRGKIYLQPTRSAEFIALDFTVTNMGNFDSV